MSKADTVAFEYAKEKGTLGFYDAVKHGYHQAEKDLELTWEDIKSIDGLCVRVNIECDLEEKEYYQEVLKRFKNLKK